MLGLKMKGPHLLFSVAGVLTFIGLVRLIRHQARHYGRASQVGAIIASAGVVFIIASKNVPASVSDEAAWNVFYLGGFLLIIGSLLFGTVALRKSWRFGVPLLAIGVFSISTIVFLMGPFNVPGYEYIGTILLPTLIGLGWTALGYALWSDETKASQTPSELLKERYAPGEISRTEHDQMRQNLEG
jgi:uncharacterized membrane protein